MAKFCGDCGKELAEDAKTCGACGKAVPIASNILNQQTVDDAKKKFASATSVIKEKGLKAVGQFREELRGINEARSKAIEEGKDASDKSKIDQAKALTRSFWGKLTGKQKTILVASFILVIFIGFKSFSHVDVESTSDDDGGSVSSSSLGPIEELNAKFYAMGPRCPSVVKNAAIGNMAKIRELQGFPYPTQQAAARNLARQTLAQLASFGCISR